MFLPLATLFGFGLLHGVGPDHCLAISTLAAGGDFRRALAVSLRFGAGHTLVLGMGTVGAMLLGVSMSVRWESLLEALGGACLVVLGLWTVFSKGAVEIPHVHLPGTPDHPHPAEHVETQRSGTLSLAMGAVFGLSGIRGVLLVIPLVVGRNPALALTGVVLFGLGVVASMVAVGVVARSASRAVGRASGILRVGVGGAATLVGVYWILGHIP